MRESNSTNSFSGVEQRLLHFHPMCTPADCADKPGKEFLSAIKSGRLKAAALKVNNPIHKNSPGIKVTQDRVAIFNNLNQERKANAEIHDLPEGTRAVVSLPAVIYYLILSIIPVLHEVIRTLCFV